VTLTEKDFGSQIEDLLFIYGWTWCHFRPAQTSNGWRTALSGHKGFPDYCAARVKDGKRQILFAELKNETNDCTAEQHEWLSVTGGYLWRPSMLEDIKRILRDGE
jgi:hypothetical protein